MDAIVEAAARILETQGHAGFSTNAVAERAGVSVGSLYQYFPSKAALVGALIKRESSQLIVEAQTAAQAPTTAQALGDLIVACVAHQCRRPNLARLLDVEEARLPFDEDTRRGGERVEALVADQLRRLGPQTQWGPDVAARDVVAIIKGMIDHAGLHGDPNPDDLALRVRKAVFGYLGLTSLDGCFAASGRT